MAESLWADLDAMRSSAAQLDGVADEVARMVADLKADLAHEGEFWGDDDPGKMIAESYVPGADKAMEGMQNLVQAVRSIQSQLASAAETFSQQDLGGAQHINKTDPTAATTDADGTGGYRSPTSSPITTPTGQSAPQSSTPGPNVNPTTTDRPETNDSAAQNNAGQSPSVQSPSAQSADPQSNAPAGNNGRDQDGNGGADNSQAPTDDSNSADTAPPGSTAAAPPSTAAANPTAGAGASPGSAKPSGSAARTTGSTAGTPWSGNSAGSPWSKSPAASSPTSSPSSGAPPRVSPPRPGGRPGADKGAEKGKKKEKRAVPQRAVPQRAETDTEAMRIAREMAARHNLEIRGFESAGIHADTVREMAAALDAMLGRYTLPLYGIEIAELAGAPSRVENRNTEAESDDPAPWIVLDRAAAANPRLLAGSTVTVPHSTRPTRPERPMYTTILRALGASLDLAGGFRARAEAQRTLIMEYLRVHGAKGDTLARVVSGYKRWRSAFSDTCFRNGVFVPAAALAEAFAAVELDGDAASGPAKALHRLLVMVAKASIFDE
ncbi:hypothetical protein [Nocardia vinacea]|uniref:hypothetical protein n=1 Tax=Nocardia vinacea TaxID=96468 RepID=UPI00031007FB|nr:hypothetical protein [Nocardia vinacea]